MNTYQSTQAIISVFEHQRLTAQDFSHASDFEWLIAQELSVFSIKRQHQQWQLKVGHYIGIIILPSNTILEILPKTVVGTPQSRYSSDLEQKEISRSRRWVEQMLNDLINSNLNKALPATTHLGQMSANLAALPDQRPPLSQWLVDQFLALLIGYQPTKHYQTSVQNQAALQGKLLIKEQLRHNSHQPHKFVSEVSHLNTEMLSNRLIKSALQLIRPLIVDTRLMRYLPAWQTITALTPSEQRHIDEVYSRAAQQLNMQPIDRRQYQIAQVLLNFAYWLLKTQQSSLPTGNGFSEQNLNNRPNSQYPSAKLPQHSQPRDNASSLRLCLLINMPQAFEQWASLRIVAMFKAHNTSYQAMYQAQHSWLKDELGQTRLSVRPDLLIYQALHNDSSSNSNGNSKNTEIKISNTIKTDVVTKWTMTNAVKEKNNITHQADQQLYSHVIDIKWKQLAHAGEVSSSDAYQLTSYAQAYQAKHLWLVYPTVDSHQLPVALHQHISAHLNTDANKASATLWLMPFNLLTGALNSWPSDMDTSASSDASY